MSGRRRRTLQSSNSIVDFDIDGDINSTRVSRPFDNELSVKFNFFDVEDVIRKFSGSETTSVGKWLDEFEKYANVFRWNDLQKFVFCKRSLTGVAKLFIDFEAKPLNYNELKRLLFKEFKCHITRAEVHTKLRERKKKNDESFREYLYCMLDIASQAEIEESSIISYVIDGIRDTVNNKVILFGANSISELKEKLIIYEKIKKCENNKSNHE